MTTKKLLVAFDPNSPERKSSDFLVALLEQSGPILLGLKSKKVAASGLVVFIGKAVGNTELFAKLVDTGRKIEHVEEALHSLEQYVQQVQEFRIGNVVSIESDAAYGFRLVMVADSPPVRASKLP